MNQPYRMSLLGQMDMTKREETPLPPCSVRDRDLGLAALAGRFFYPLGTERPESGLYFCSRRRCRLPEGQRGDEGGLRVENLLSVI